MKTTVLLLSLPAAFAATGDRCSVGTNGAIVAWDPGAKNWEGVLFSESEESKIRGQAYFDEKLKIAPIQNPPVIMECDTASTKLASLNVLTAIDLVENQCTTDTCSCYSASIAANIYAHQYTKEETKEGIEATEAKSTGVTYAGQLTSNMYACGKKFLEVPVSNTQNATTGEIVYSDDFEDTPKDGSLKCYTVTGGSEGVNAEGTVTDTDFGGGAEDGVKTVYIFKRCICNSLTDTDICNNADTGTAQQPTACTVDDVTNSKPGCATVGDDLKVVCTAEMEADKNDKNCATGSTGKQVLVLEDAPGVAAGKESAKAPDATLPGDNGASSATVGYSMLVAAAVVALKA